MSITDYESAYKLGKKEYQQRMVKGKNPTLPVLDDILPAKGSYSSVPLGRVEIPAERIVGTKTLGRSNAFAANFMPILPVGTEFEQKWSSLSTSHLEEGIRDPIKVYEYMNQFYVEEGNKRVSVMKYFEVPFISGDVIRVIPKKSDEPENKLYYEFMEFYELTKINYIWFSKEGSFKKLHEAAGKESGEHWTEDECKEFRSAFWRFKKEFEKKSKKLTITTGDAFLVLINLHGYDNICEFTPNEFKTSIEKTWKEFSSLDKGKEVELKLDPTDKKPLFGKIHKLGMPKLKVAFIYEKTTETSAWTYCHELGRMHLQEKFPDEIDTVYYENVTSETIEEVLQKALAEGCNIIFTTTPAFAQASLKAAIDFPSVRFVNCSVNTSHRYIRTYYVRMHEAKFLMGAIAGAMAENDRIMYIADYPISGTIANINAFALGAKMVNPRAEIYLEWNCLKDNKVAEHMEEIKPSCISARDMRIPKEESRFFGIYHMEDGVQRNLALPLLHWGKFYEKLVRAIMDGSWKYDDDSDKAINYWWGMSSGVIDVICSRNLPIGTKRLIELLKQTIMSGEFNPFTGVLYSQEGVVQDDPDRSLTPDEIVHMDWLAENVIGYIPTKEELIESAIPVVTQQGVEKKG